MFYILRMYFVRILVLQCIHHPFSDLARLRLTVLEFDLSLISNAVTVKRVKERVNYSTYEWIRTFSNHNCFKMVIMFSCT